MTANALAGRRIAVTGASGFVGRRVVAALTAEGAAVEAFGRRDDPGLPAVAYTRWDIAGGPLDPRPPVDALVHCAGMVTDWGPRAGFQRCHVDGTRHVLASFPEPCPVVHVSTASVYDPRLDKRLLSEDAPTDGGHLNAYSRSKARAEPLVRARHAAIVLRPHALYGPGDTVLLPRLLEARRGGRLIAAGDGRNQVSLTHVDNLVDAILLSLRALLAGASGGIYNIADDAPVVMDDALRAVLVACGLAPRVSYLSRPLAYALGAMLELAGNTLHLARAPRLTRYRVVQVADDFVLDLARARRELGYRPVRDLASFIAAGGLADAAAGLRAAAGASSTSSRP